MTGLTWAWHADQPASKADIDRLRAIAPVPLPEAYVRLLSEADGYEAPISVQPLWLVLYPANEVVDDALSGTFKEFFGDFFVIGGNGAGEAIALDMRPGREGAVVAFDMTNIDLNESVMKVAEDFEELLTKIEA